MSSPGAGCRRKNGKHFHAVKSAFRPSKGLSTFAKRMGTKREYDEMRQRERTMAEGMELERQTKIARIKERRAALGEKQRYEQLAQRMHTRKVERLKRKERRNKRLKS